MSESERRAYLVSRLREELYWSFYCHGGPRPARWDDPEPVGADPWLTSAMSEANGGSGSWETGWTIERVQGGDAVAATARLRARVRVADCRPESGAIAPGSRVSVRMPKELPALSPGFYTVVGDAGTDPVSPEGMVRVYWNVAPAGAPTLVSSIASRLNAEQVRFRLKVANHPFRFDRCDAAVLYVRTDVFRALRGTLRDIASQLRASLGPSIPAFTLELLPGVGLAEDADSGESFGERRCLLAAEAIVRAHEEGMTDVGARVAVVAKRFEEAAVSIDAPYLEPTLAGRHVL